MIVNRIICVCKLGKGDELVSLLADEARRTNLAHGWRLYKSLANDSNTTFSGEYQFQSQAELTEYWKTWAATPEGRTFLDKYHALLEKPDVVEVWEVIDSAPSAR